MENLQPANTIEGSPEYLDGLHRLVATKEQLKAIGYIVDPLTNEDFNAKRRCANCGKRPKIRKPRKHREKRSSKSTKNGLANGVGESDSDSSKKSGSEDSRLKQDEEKDNFQCHFHSGNVQFKYWTCCQQHVSAKKPCKALREHDLRIYPVGALEKRWAYYPTPAIRPQEANPTSPKSPALQHARSNSQGQGQGHDWRRRGHRRGAQSEASVAIVPPQRWTRQPRLAVALDCEMGTAEDGESELIRLTVIDYFSGAVLIDSLVWPSVPMAHYNTRFSGVSWSQMQKARRDGTCIRGLQAAREQVWRFVGPDTIVVGHGANSDLSSLRWLHRCVLDTFQVEMHLREEKMKAEEEEEKAREEAVESAGKDGEEEPADSAEPETEEAAKAEKEEKTEKTEKTAKEKPPEERLSLKALTLRRLGRHIQLRTQKGHSSLEDAIATRDLADWHVKQTLGADKEAVQA